MAKEVRAPEVVPSAETGMDRREFMRQTLLAGLALLAAPTVLSGLVGCGSGAPCAVCDDEALGRAVARARAESTALRDEIFASGAPSLADLERWLAEMNRIYAQLHSAVSRASGAALRDQVHSNYTAIADRLYDEWHESMDFSGPTPVFTREGYRAATARAHGILAGLDASEIRAIGFFVQALCVGHGSLDNDTILALAQLAATRDTEGRAGLVHDVFHPVRPGEVSAAGFPTVPLEVWYFLAMCLFWGMESEVLHEYGMLVPCLWVILMVLLYLFCMFTSFR